MQLEPGPGPNDVTLSVRRGDEVCDFCSGRPVAWSYPVQDFKIDPKCGSQGDWAACEECSALIEAGKRQELFERSVGSLLDRNPQLQPFISQHIGATHAGFFENRAGDRETDEEYWKRRGKDA